MGASPKRAARPVRPGAVLVAGREGLRLAAAGGQPRPAPPEELEAILQSVDAVLLDEGAGPADLPRGAWRRILAALETLPVFFWRREGDGPRADLPAPTVFDRIVAPEPVSERLEPWRLPVPGADLDAVLPAIRADLAADRTAPAEDAEDYAPDAYWERRATESVLPGRAVCYRTAPRALNKAMHAVQVAALTPALGRAARHLAPHTTRPALIDYGCGVGRLAPVVRPHAAYHGVDIAPSMVAAAHAMHPDLAFCTVPQMPSADWPAMDILMTVTVLHHNPPEGRARILADCAALCGPFVRLILLEDFIPPGRESANMFPLETGGLLDAIAAAFGGVCTLSGMRLLGYKPQDYLQRTALLELDVHR